MYVYDRRNTLVKTVADKDFTLSVKGKSTPAYYVDFDKNDGKKAKSKVMVKYKVIVKGKKIGKLPTAKRKGYTFKGWYTKKNGGKKIKSSKIVKKDITLYAHWKKE
jgi:uncharacterized repeat protein (TIGR02543 family)